MNIRKRPFLLLRKIFLLITINIIIFHSVYSQSDNNLLEIASITNYNNVIPSSPNAASLGKYGDIPVSMYTGVPSINIPIFEMNSKITSVPISLTYHASGVRMNEVPGWLGTGWSLNAGGVISRSVIGRPDDLEIYGYFNNELLPTPDEINDWITLDSWDIPSGFLSPIFKGIWDLQPDSYSFNFLGYTGKLIITNDGEAYTVPYNKWIINIIYDTQGNITGFNITTDDGTKYSFGGAKAVEKSLFNPSECSPEVEEIDYITAWYLTRISSPRVSSEINFTYLPVNDKEIENISETRYFNINNLYGPPGCQGNCPDEQYSCSSTIKYSQILLNQIISDSYTITFSNQEIGGGVYKLNSILINDNFSNNQKNVLLNYSVFGDRHFLISVLEGDKTYSFSYIHPNLLGDINAFSQDYWGFYNGITTNNTYVPRTVLGPNKVIEGADRHIDEEKMKYGTLETITYPTKGKTKFIYEPHDYLTNEVTDFTDIIFFDVDVMADVVDDPAFSSSFTIDFSQDVNYIVDAESNFPPEPPDNELKLLKLINGEFTEIDILPTGHQTHIEGMLMLDEGTYKLQSTVFLPGSLECTLTYKELENGSANEWRNEKVGGLRIKRIENYSADGNLIYSDDYMYRETEDPSISTGILVNENISYKSSMTKYMPPPCSDKPFPTEVLDCNFKCHYLLVSSSPQVPFGTTNGSHVGYKEVTIFKGGFEHQLLPPHQYEPLVTSEPNNNGIGKNGKIVKYYTNPEEYPDLYISMYNPGISKDWKRGLLKREEVFDSTNLLLKKEELEYQLADTNNYHRTPGVKVTLRGTRYSLYDPYEYLVKPYYKESPWKYQTKKMVYEYKNNNELKTETLFNYNPFDTQLKKITTVFPDSSAVRKTFYHPLNLYNLPWANTMVSKNMYNVPIITDILRNDNYILNPDNFKIANSQLVSYQDYFPKEIYKLTSEELLSPGTYTLNAFSNGLHVTDENFRKESTTTYIDGNLTEYENYSGEKAIIIWGYNNMFPVIKAANIGDLTYTEFENLVNSAVPSGYNNINALLIYVDKLELISQKDVWKVFNENLRSLPELSKVLISTHTYNSLKGMTSQTDPNGKTTYYEYDDFDRLKLVKDQDGNIIKTYEYNYKQD